MCDFQQVLGCCSSIALPCLVWRSFFLWQLFLSEREYQGFRKLSILSDLAPPTPQQLTAALAPPQRTVSFGKHCHTHQALREGFLKGAGLPVSWHSPDAFGTCTPALWTAFPYTFCKRWLALTCNRYHREIQNLNRSCVFIAKDPQRAWEWSLSQPSQLLF